MRMRKECTMHTFLQLIGLGDLAAEILTRHAIRARHFSRKAWALFIQAAHKVNMISFAMKLDIIIGKSNSKVMTSSKTIQIQLKIQKTTIWEQDDLIQDSKHSGMNISR